MAESIAARVARLHAEGRLPEPAQASAVARGWLPASAVSASVQAAAAGKATPEQDKALAAIESAKSVPELKDAVIAWIKAQR